MIPEVSPTDTPLPPSEGAHRRLLDAVQARQKSHFWQVGALVGVSAWVALSLFSLFLMARFPGVARGLFFFAPFLGGGLFLALGPGLARRRVGDDVGTARLLSQQVPHLSLSLLAAVELNRDPPSPGASEALKRAFLDRLDHECAALSASQVVSDTPVRHAQAGALSTLSLLLFSLALSENTLKQGLKTAFTFPRSEIQRQREPITGDVELTYRYPAYTGLVQRVVPGTNGEVSAPRGTVVSLKTRADRPVQRADLVYEGKRVPLKVEEERELSGSFTVDKTGHYQFVFYGRSDRPLAEGPPLGVQAEADAVPTVQLKSPQEELEIDLGQKVTLSFEASDDHGLSELHLVYRGTGQEDTRVALPLEEGRRARGNHVWDTSSLSLTPGQRLTYFLEVKDNDGIDGPKRGVSRTQVLKLYSAAEHRREAVKKAEALWEQLITHLGDRLEGPTLSGQKTPETLSSEKVTDESGKRLYAEFLEASRELSLQREAQRELVAALFNVGQALKRRVQATTDARRFFSLRLPATENLEAPRQRLLGMVSQEVAQVEKDALYLESLLDRQRMQDLRELAEQLSRDRRELSRLIEQYQKSQSEPTKEAILQDIQKMKARIAEMMQRMSELARGIRDEHLNQEALMEMMEEQNLSSSLDDVERLMREGKTDEALAKLQELGMEMEQMLENLEAGEEELGSAQFPELAEKFQGFMEDLQETVEQQQKVSQKTQALRDRYKEALKERVKERGQALKKEILKTANEVLSDYKSLTPDQLNARAEQPLDVAQKELEHLKQALDANDFDLAAESALRAEQAAEELAVAAQAQKSLDEAFQNPEAQRQKSAQTAERLEKDSSKVERMSQKLQELFPKAGQMMSAADQQNLKDLAKKQRQLEQQASGLKQQMDEMSQMAPLFNDDALEQMAQVQNRMGQAAEKMEGQDAQRGLGDQKAALDQLQQFQQEMQQSRSGKGKKGGLPLPMFSGKGEGFGQKSRDKVEVPDADASQAPREFRKDLLDAMKQGAPEKYKEQVKRYYEELVK